MNPEQIHIKPNVPVTLALADPLGDSANFDFELRVGRFSTVDGRVLVLPETAAIALNTVSPQAGESIEITRIWSGRSCDRERWRIILSSEAQEARRLAGGPGGTEGTKEASQQPPAPIDRPVLRRMPKVEQPPLFENFLGTGTDGPRPRPVPREPRTPARCLQVKTSNTHVTRLWRC
jgi:hypothetical protein